MPGNYDSYFLRYEGEQEFPLSPVPVPLGIYRLTVRGDTRIPSFSRISAAILSSPQVTFCSTTYTMNFWSSTGIRGRPCLLLFQRHKKRKPFRCQPIIVSGFTMTKASFQAKSRERSTKTRRVGSSARRAFTFHSANRASRRRSGGFQPSRKSSGQTRTVDIMPLIRSLEDPWVESPF